LDRADGELAEAQRLAADNRFSSLARLKSVGFTGSGYSGYWGVPKIRALFEATIFAGPENCRNRLIRWQSEMVTAVLPMRVFSQCPNATIPLLFRHRGE
jgi:hypothetical protein